MLSVFSRNDGPGSGLLRTTEGPAGQRTIGDFEGILSSSHVRKQFFSYSLCFHQTFFKASEQTQNWWKDLSVWRTGLQLISPNWLTLLKWKYRCLNLITVVILTFLSWFLIRYSSHSYTRQHTKYRVQSLTFDCRTSYSSDISHSSDICKILNESHKVGLYATELAFLIFFIILHNHSLFMIVAGFAVRLFGLVWGCHTFTFDLFNLSKVSANSPYLHKLYTSYTVWK